MGVAGESWHALITGQVEKIEFWYALVVTLMILVIVPALIVGVCALRARIQRQEKSAGEVNFNPDVFWDEATTHADSQNVFSMKSKRGVSDLLPRSAAPLPTTDRPVEVRLITATPVAATSVDLASLIVQDSNDADGNGPAQRVQRAAAVGAVPVRHGASGRVQRSALGDWVRGKLGWSARAPAAPERDPMQKVYNEFMRRVNSLQSEIPQLKGQNVTATGEALWAAYCGTISGAKGMSRAGGGEVDLAAEGKSNQVPESAPGRRDNRATNPMYYNEEAGAPAAKGEQLQQGSYETNMSESFNLLTNALKGLSQLQFDRYRTFAFWNGPGAKDVAVAAKGGGVLALESSAIGALFDGFGSYAEFSQGIESTSWDPQLWAALSRAYAMMVMDAIVKDPSKRIVIICGLGYDDPGYNIWNSIESQTLQLGDKRAGLGEQDLIEATTYLGVAGRMDGDKPVVDMNSSCEGVAGTWVSARTAAEMKAAQRQQSDRNAAKPA